MSPDLVGALVHIIEAKDHSTAAHTWRVVLYTRAMAELAGVAKGDIARLTFAAALHDVGKIDVADEILQKPGALTADEFEAMKRHTVLGHERLVRMEEEDPMLLGLVRHHHERPDGLGYPDGLTRDQIPVAARYFSVIDSFDAMTSLRPYRMEVGREAARKAVGELQAGAGSRYCHEAVEMFADLYHTGRLHWILEYFNDSCPVPGYEELRDVEGVREGKRSKG